MKRPSITELLHIGFGQHIGDQKADRVTDGGGTDRGRERRRARGRAAKAARKKQRGR